VVVVSLAVNPCNLFYGCGCYVKCAEGFVFGAGAFFALAFCFVCVVRVLTGVPVPVRAGRQGCQKDQ